ncbi:putative glycosyl transferase [Smithella sp. ME-1]|uniref:Glycosyltransferase n=1 Tax=hydrocarbon metagenome TaxID=938273 RepID=A0A0W8FQJ1_9ZZZZ|nr:putative glycosyl transferase [Smithella sp. ME-1]
MGENKPIKIRLIMVSGDFPPRISGVGDYAWHIARTASVMGAAVTVITTKNQYAQESFPNDNLDIRPIMDMWQFNEAKKLFRILDESDDRSIVNIQYNCPFTYGRRLLINFLPAMIRTFYPKIKVVVTMHGFWEQSLKFRLRALPMMRAAHGVIYVDRLNKMMIKKYSGLPENRLMFIPIAGNILPIPCTTELRNTWRRELQLKDTDTAIAFFGGIGRNKGFEYLIEALEIARNRKRMQVIVLAIGGFHSDVMGNSYQTEITNLINKLGMDKYVRILESLNSKDVSKYLHAADIAVYPFLNGVGENSGSMLAALAHGLPTIITKGPANDSSFTDRLGVFMVPSKNAEELANVIEKIIVTPAMQQTMRDKAIEVSNILSWDYVTSTSMKLFMALSNIP